MPTDGAAKRPASDDQPLAELRAILLGPDREAWETMRQRLDNPRRRAEDIASVLAEAVRLRSDAKLRRALQPLLEEALQLSVQSNPRMLADALFPIFGKAIRKAITAELDGMLQSLSQTLEQRFSWRSLRWRWEALRTGKRLRGDRSAAQPAVPCGTGFPDPSQDWLAAATCHGHRGNEGSGNGFGHADRDPGFRSGFR